MGSIIQTLSLLAFILVPSSSYKPAVLVNGLKIQVPQSIPGEMAWTFQILGREI